MRETSHLGTMSVNTEIRTLKRERERGWELASSFEQLHQLWTAYSHTSYDTRKIKRFSVSHSRWGFVTIGKTYSLTQNRAYTCLSKCLIQQTKGKSATSSSMRLGRRESPLQCSIHSGERNTIDFRQTLFSSQSRSSFPQMWPCG